LEKKFMKKSPGNYRRNIFLLLILPALCVSAALAQTAGIKLNVDATEAARNILHVSEKIPVKPGRFRLFYPKWIPGEHSPTGPLNDMVNLFISANGKPVAWTRDDVEMFAFECEIPAGASELEIAFDDVSQPGTTASAQLARIKWNRLLLYPRGVPSDNIQVSASLKLPADWKYATALPVARETGSTADFKSVSLTTLVDSPAIIGKFFAKIQLPGDGALTEMDMAADNAGALTAQIETLRGWKEMVRQANLMFGARHYNSYRFLLTLSDAGGSEGLEHHESSEDGVGEKALSDQYGLIDLADLLGHEYAHSWNGKYRRPAGLATADFEQPMRGELLWVYEGLTEYLGKVLPSRSGLWTPRMFCESVAFNAADMDHQSGRKWRPLADTARAIQFTYAGARPWRNARRGADYYSEGMLVWLDADILIRQKSGGKLSLDDFLRKFHGGQNSGPAVRPYDLNEIVKTLNEVVTYDWKGFFYERVYSVSMRAPLGGITNGGWKLVYDETPNLQIELGEHLRKTTNLFFSIGILLSKDGEIRDVDPDLPAGKAGLAPGMTIKNVDGREFSAEVMRQALTAAKNNSAPIVLTVDNSGFEQTFDLNYHGGLLYPHLVRDAAKPDLLSGIIRPL
jgi:predicted metalloprotease with PDZ domain